MDDKSDRDGDAFWNCVERFEQQSL
jgi:hypothetical protein